MIFVTVGTSQYPFDRLLRAMERAILIGRITERVFAQIGAAKPGVSFEHTRFLGVEQMVENIRAARIVVAHAGVGTALLSLSLGKVPILFPRMAKYGEVVDDHQWQFVRLMDRNGKAIGAYDEDDLVEKIDSYPLLTAGLSADGTTAGPSELAAYLDELIKGQRKDVHVGGAGSRIQP
jgi:UDP-N-acetylglucosamine transferase subunit ALG13